MTSIPPSRISTGQLSPLGSSKTKTGVNFALFSEHAAAVLLCVFSKDGSTELQQIPLSRGEGNVWSVHVSGLTSGQLYGYRVDGPYAPRDGHRFNVNKLLIDPYAKDLFGSFIQHDAIYGYDINSPDKDLSFSDSDSAPYIPKSVAGDILNPIRSGRPDQDWADLIIYEAHIKGVTKRKSDVKAPQRGTCDGLASRQMIAHLKSLGVTAVEVLPVQSFFTEPRLTNLGLTNYWGYNPVNYFAPHTPYLGAEGRASFQAMVQALHAAGISVILDVVYNHTAESWELGPTLSYRGIDNANYYHLKSDRRYYENYTGCGNSVNMTHPQVLAMTMSSLRYWHEVMGVDGFRFDLGPTMARNPHDYDRGAPFLKALATDPVLSGCKLISEPWDVGPGGYQLGGFPNGWAEWNDKYRDSVRSFWRGDAFAHKDLAGRLLGSAEQFNHSGRSALSSINFLTSHDGFTLHDVVSYNGKHNLANLENNRDGHGHNLSDNMGAEGPSDDKDIVAARRQRKKNMLATLFLSQGIPMILGGDEIGHSQRGNNNAYCQDNETTWLDWENVDTELMDCVKALSALRRAYPQLSCTEFLHGEKDARGVPNVQWLTASGAAMHPGDWESPDLSALLLVLTPEDQNSLVIAINRGGRQTLSVRNSGWTQVFSTAPNTDNASELPANSVSVFAVNGAALSSETQDKTRGRLSAQYGIVDSYRNISGRTHVTSDAMKDRLLAAMGVKGGQPPMQQKSETLSGGKTKSNSVYGAEYLMAQGGVWGVTCALYGLTSDRGWGVGDFEDLAVFAESMAGKGADFIGINPIHALFPSAPHLYAPYSPSSREFLNVMAIAPDKIPEFGGKIPKAAAAARNSEFVDYALVYALKSEAFKRAFETFEALPKTHNRKKTFAKFFKSGGKALQQHALFEAIFETLSKSKQTYAGWKNFPKNLQDPDSKACKVFAEKHSGRIRYFCYLQWVARAQVQSAQDRALAAGMTVGLYLDFAVGVVDGGSDAWRRPEIFAKGVSLGAPGDMANPDGQMWNLLPFNPHALQAENFLSYKTALASAMTLGGALRIDHILGLLRSFWIPEEGGSGAYVSYPFDAIVDAVAQMSFKHQCCVFGEDLGTVPDGFRDKMAARDLMGCGVHLIEKNNNNEILPRDAIRTLSMTGYTNHDFPTLSGFWSGDDFRWRRELGIGDNPEVLSWEEGVRRNDKARLIKLAAYDEKADIMTPDLMAALQSYLAASPALALAVQLDDLTLETAQANIPGTTEEQPNWRRKCKLTLAEIHTDSAIKSITEAISKERPRHDTH